MRPKRGTPNKLNNVKKLRKIFEISSSSPATEGYVELLSQSNKRLNPTNLSTTMGCTRLKPKLYVIQPGGGTKTGPRQDIGTSRIGLARPGWGLGTNQGRCGRDLHAA